MVLIFAEPPNTAKPRESHRAFNFDCPDLLPEQLLFRMVPVRFHRFERRLKRAQGWPLLRSSLAPLADMDDRLFLEEVHAVDGVVVNHIQFAQSPERGAHQFGRGVAIGNLALLTERERLL